MSQKTVQATVMDFYRSRLANDVSACMAHYAPDAVLRIAGTPGPTSITETASGAEATCRMQSELIAAWEWRDQKIESMTIQGDRAAVHYALTAAFTPTGEVIESELVDIITLRDGKIVSLVEFVDTSRVAQHIASARMASARKA
jgi:ketosteroid isomerase-like protein